MHDRLCSTSCDSRINDDNRRKHVLSLAKEESCILKMFDEDLLLDNHLAILPATFFSLLFLSPKSLS